MNAIFEAISSLPRRKILAYLAEADLNAGEIAERFVMSKPAVTKHLQILQNAGLITSEKKGQFVIYSLTQESLTNTLNGFMSSLCPVASPLKKESAKIAKNRLKAKDN
jgi:ArsR family transcriptional regulator, arsenate/arsenite/antimonite-responsive transcriptional repressor